MKRNIVYFSISMIVILSMLAGTTASTASSAKPADLSSLLRAAMTAEEVMAILPRYQTLYMNGQQWGEIAGWNPYSTSMNNAMALAQKDNARVTVFETPYVYNNLTGEQLPLLADGPYTWDGDRLYITFHLKPAAHWSDGTPVTAEDVVYTWNANVLYQTSVGVTYQDYIEHIYALNPTTVMVMAKQDHFGFAVNPLMLEAYLNSVYVIQKAWTQTLEARTGGDPDDFKSDPALDFVSSGPYTSFMWNDLIVVLERDDNYWGQDDSMWGKLPTPKYLAHVIYSDNEDSMDAFLAGEVDLSQQFIPNVQDLWLVEGMPVSTYLPDAPYMVGTSLPTAFYNLSSYGMNQIAIRKAIAIAVDYNTIITNAMTNQSATFDDVPRSLMSPLPSEQAMYDHAAVAGLQWAGNDIAGAIALLNAAGITDTNADGWREYNGQTLHYTATCPNGWTDWMAAIEVVADAGQAIGIDITTNFPEWSVYQTVVTNWSVLDGIQGYDIFMMWSDGAGPAQPWSRIHHLIGSEYAQTDDNWNGNWGGYSNLTVDSILNTITRLTNPVLLKEQYTNLTEIYLTDIPSFTLMYRPDMFHTVYEGVWTGFPHQGDGTNPLIPPLMLTDGYSIAGLYHLRYNQPYSFFLPMLRR